MTVTAKLRVALLMCALAGALAVFGCTPAQFTRAQALQAKIEAATVEACGVANQVAAIAAPFSGVPQVAGMLSFVSAGCGTSEAVAALVTKALNDPSTIAWTQHLADQLREAIAKVRG